MRLRKLILEDAPAMLDWMHDTQVVQFMQTDFSEKQIEDCMSFIKRSWNCQESLHLAIVDDSDQYKGTVSLKNITEKDAEFAIAICAEAMGKGYSRYAMKEMIKIGFERELSSIYWCVNPQNKRAVRFYDREGYTRVSCDQFINKLESYRNDEIESLYWYVINFDKAV